MPRCVFSYGRKLVCRYVNLNKAVEGVEVPTQVWKYLPGCGSTYPGVEVPTRVWKYLPGCGSTYPGVEVPTQVWKYLPSCESTYPGKLVRNLPQRPMFWTLSLQSTVLKLKVHSSRQHFNRQLWPTRKSLAQGNFVLLVWMPLLTSPRPPGLKFVS
jgi:hypothetical protein